MLGSNAPVAQLDRALVSGCKSGPQAHQAEPTNSQRNLAHRRTAFGVSCSLSAGVVGQFIGQSARKPKAEGCGRETYQKTDPAPAVLALLDVGEEHGNAQALARGFSLEQSFLAFGDVAPFAKVLAEFVCKEA